MTIRNPARLLALSERMFRHEAEAKPAKPATGKFKGMAITLRKYDRDWDRRRGAAVRFMGVLLRDDDQALQSRVCTDDKSCETYGDAAIWLDREASHLRRTAKLLDTAASRLNVVLARCCTGSAMAGATQ